MDIGISGGNSIARLFCQIAAHLGDGEFGCGNLLLELGFGRIQLAAGKGSQGFHQAFNIGQKMLELLRDSVSDFFNNRCCGYIRIQIFVVGGGVLANSFHN